ncbi:MAG: archease [Planctomycetaceae bacterium]|nr:archease [Planctomycetaceae bacterium]
MWEHFAHQSDIGIRAQADSLGGAFEDAAVGLTAIVTDPSAVIPAQSVNIECLGEDEEDLFFKWMSKIIFEMDVRKMLFSKYEVKIDSLKLSAVAWGEKVNFGRHSPAVESKAVTLNQLCVKNENGKWICQCVIDV